MSKGIEILKETGVQRIYEKTHIPIKHIKALFQDDFKSLNKVQFFGFVSILEREYELDLSELRAKGDEYFKTIKNDQHLESRLFVTTQKQKKYTKIYLFTAFLILAGVAFYTLSKPSSAEFYKIKNIKKEKILSQDTNTTTAVAKKEAVIKKEDKNVTKKQILNNQPAITKSLKIIPRRKLWVGYMDMDTGKKMQNIFRDELVLNPAKRWLLSLGHGDVDFEIDGKMQEFHSKENIKFVYENSHLRKIDMKEFKRLNKGIKW